jgi:SAM-dependent methyltransferase
MRVARSPPDAHFDFLAVTVGGLRTGPEYFDGQAQRWPRLYRSKPVFGDRFNLFVGGIQRAFPSPARILDFGCGPGVMALALGRMGHAVVGVDAAPAMLREAEQERKRLGLDNVRFVLMDADHPALASDTFDAVICSSVLQYVADDRQLLVDLVSILRPGGLLFVSLPHRASALGVLEAGSARLQQVIRPQGGGFLRYSLRRYTKGRFLRLLESLSMSPLQCTYFDLPLLGKYGIPLSRLPLLGILLLVVARREGQARAPRAAAIAIRTPWFKKIRASIRCRIRRVIKPQSTSTVTPHDDADAAP